MKTGGILFSGSQETSADFGPQVTLCLTHGGSDVKS